MWGVRTCCDKVVLPISEQPLKGKSSHGEGLDNTKTGRRELMQKMGIYFKLKPGAQKEYKKRHDEIWPEMIQALNQAGMHNYSIWNHGNFLFSYLEVNDFERSQKILASNPVYERWRKYMEDIIEIDEETGEKEYFMNLMFFHA